MEPPAGLDPWVPVGTKEQMIDDVKALSLPHISRPEVNNFGVGDLIHPKEGSNIKGRGRPHIVVETYALQKVTPEDGKPCNFQDMVIAVVLQGRLVMFNNDSVYFELFEKEKK